MYTLLPLRHSIALVLVSLTIIGLLVFSAGVMVGLRLDLHAVPGPVATFKPLTAARNPAFETVDAQPPGRPAGLAPMVAPVVSLASLQAAGDQAEASGSRVSASPSSSLEPSSLEPSSLEPSKAESVPGPSGDVAGRTDARTFSVQVGAFSHADYAEDRLADLSAEGFEAYLEEITTPSGSILVSVRFGDYSDSHAAWTAALEWAAGGPGREAIVLLGSGP